jgi:hypothetical protein
VCPVCGLLLYLHLVGILFSRVIDDARSKPHQTYSLLKTLTRYFGISRCPRKRAKSVTQISDKGLGILCFCRKYFYRLPSTKIFNSEYDPIVINKYTNFYYPHQIKQRTYINILYILSPAICFDLSALFSASLNLVFCILTYFLSYLFNAAESYLRS